MPIAPGPRVLSIKPPYAWAIMIGRKKVENRSWTTAYRGTVYIHAGKHFTRADAAWLRETFRLEVPADVVRGAVVATAELADVVTGHRARRFGKWFSGEYGFVLRDVRPLRRPVPTKGRLKLYRPSPSLRRAVERQVR